jgi:ubiquitin-conjugating enzyme E2 G1
VTVYPDGKVCIPILHEPGVDRFNAQETADERWRPILGIETVLVSVISMLADPNIDSPANIDAAKMLRDDPKAFKRKVRRTVEKTLE